MGNAPRGVNVLVAGWQLQGIYALQSGQPFGFGNAFFTGDLHDIPLAGSKRTVDRWFNTDAGFVRDSRLQPAFNYRSMSTRFNGIRGRHVNNWDLSVIKDTRLRERAVLEMRFEAVNAFNRPNFATPVTNPASSTFGRILSQDGYSREIQFGAKLRF